MRNFRGQQAEPDAQYPDLWRGTISRISGADVYVVVPAYDPRREHGPAAVIAPAGPPSVGAEVHVAFREDAEPVVFVAGFGSTGGTGSVAFATLTKMGTD